MATIRKRIGRHGDETYTAMVRRAGFPTLTKTFPTERAAEKWATLQEAGIIEGKVSTDALGRKRTLGQAIDRFREEALPLMKDGTMYGFTLDWFKEHHGDKRLGEISRGWLSEVRGTLLAGKFTRATPGTKRSLLTALVETNHFQRTPATCNRYMAALSSVFSHVCGDWEWLQPHSNPFLGFSKLPEGKNKGRAYADQARYRLLRETAQDPQLHVMVQVSLATTARAGELLKLEWSQVEFMPTRPGEPAHARLTFEDTKNGDTRTAWLFGDAMAALQAHKDRWNRDGYITASGELIPGCTLVFPGAWNSRKRAHGKYDYLKPLHAALARAGITMKRPFHALRHTAATDMVRMGANRHQLKGAGGWKSNAVDVYVHLGNEDTKDLLQRHQTRLTQEGK